MAKQVGFGLMYLHYSGVVHRDLTSMNVLVDKQYNVKISTLPPTRFCLTHHPQFVHSLHSVIVLLTLQKKTGDFGLVSVKPKSKRMTDRVGTPLVCKFSLN